MESAIYGPQSTIWRSKKSRRLTAQSASESYTQIAQTIRWNTHENSCLSDLHRDKDATARIVEASRHADLVVGAGDFAMRGVGLADTIHLLELCRAPLLVVSGNHDSSNELRTVCDAVPHFTYLDGSGVRISGWGFYGIGREIPFQKNAEWSEHYSEDQARNLLENCPDGAILISHSPPFGVVDFQPMGATKAAKLC